MSRVSLQNGCGPGSSITLAPETIRVRNALIEKFTGEPLDEMNQFMNTALAAEKNELRRIGILAARIFLLRTRIANLQDFNRDPSLTKISEINVGALGLGGTNMDAAVESDDDVTKIEDGWTRLKMTSTGEVQGVRFLSGAIIDTKPEDAEKLIQAGKAVRVNENGHIIDLDKDDYDNPDEPGTTAEADDLTKDANENSEKTSDDSETTSDDSETTSDDSETTSDDSETTSDDSETTSDDSETTSDDSETTSDDSAKAEENTSSAMTDEQTAETKNGEQPAMAAADDAAGDDTTNADAEQLVSPDDELLDNADKKT